MRKGWVRAAKWTWVVCVVIAVALVLQRSWSHVSEIVGAISVPALATSFSLIAIAKLLLAENARIAAAQSGLYLDVFTAGRLYNLSQLLKYLPGSIWQYVARAAAYRGLSASYLQIRDALLTESLWVVGGAGFIGAVLIGPMAVTLVATSVSPRIAVGLTVVIASTTLLLLASAVRRGASLLRYLRGAAPPPRVLLVQAAIWGLLGLSFWVLLSAFGLSASVVFCTGLFAIAYSVGFLVPFAPAGLGVRDAILVAGLLPLTGVGEALVVTILARVLYLMVELVLVGLQELLILLRPALRRTFDALPPKR